MICCWSGDQQQRGYYQIYELILLKSGSRNTHKTKFLFYMTLFLKQIVSFILFQILFQLTSFTQNINLDWVKTIGLSTNDEAGISLALDSNKAVIFTGHFRSTLDFDPGPGVFNLTSTGGQDIFIAEYDSSGNFVWAKKIGGVPDDDVLEMKMDSSGNLFVLGYFQGTTDFDPGPGVYNLTTTSRNTFLLKLDNNANFIWVKQGAYTGNQIDTDVSGNVFMGGWFAAAKDFDPGAGVFTLTANTGGEDMFVLKLDPSGNFTWAKQIRNLSGSQHGQRGLETDSAGNVFFGGDFTLTMDFDPGATDVVLTAAGGANAFILKLTGQGDFMWAKQFGAPGVARILGLEVDNSGNVFSTGQFFFTVDFDPGAGSYPLTANSNFRCCFISKLDPNGNFIYAKNFQGGETFGRALAIDADNYLYVAGEFHSAVDFDPGAGTFTIPGGGLFTVRLDPLGNFSWAAGYSPSSGSFESIYGSIKVDILKNVYFTGSFPFTVDFDPTPAVYNVTSPGVGRWDIFVHKLGQCNSLNVINVTACSGYTLNNTTYTSSGVYYQSLTNNAGCDSIIQLNLTIGNVFNQLAVNACGSYLWNGNLLTTSGIYRDTIQLSNGCDSIVELDLTITRIANNLTMSACGSYIWKGNPLTSSGIYRDTIRLANGCDSIVILNLVINQKPIPRLGADTVICKPDMIVLSPGVFNQYLWSDNTTGSTLSVADTGTYWVNVTSSNNCSARDTIVIRKSGQCGCALNAQTKIYTNPFTTTLIVDKNATNCEVRMDLYNAIGQLIMKDKIINDGFNVLQLGKLSSGMYFYRLYADGNMLLKGKLIKL